ncbi:hypothetical protein UFOVP112_390 [uncultured Caudovirales phage]|uniref:Uncharacterized protein n=1 Tax=uncultured Caudovirales phage TaxID=2100421 RepID=A0A6J5L6Y4_9CAUD|nr:hypothetical protein UFOVP112_390 [uncultured Caudovirales phage]
MNNVYSILVTIGGMLVMLGLLVLIRFANDATFTGWRLRRWHERSVPQVDRPWRPWFAWRPVRTVTGELVWWDTVYRMVGNTYVDQENFTWYYYGTVFEALKDNRD